MVKKFFASRGTRRIVTVFTYRRTLPTPSRCASGTFTSARPTPQPPTSGFILSGFPTKSRYASLRACYIPANFCLLELVILINNASQRVQIIKLHTNIPFLRLLVSYWARSIYMLFPSSQKPSFSPRHTHAKNG
jgi:hypothetical protein